MLGEANEVLRQDPVMAELIETHELQELPEWDEYERLCISIINQQLSTASANAVRERVFALVDGPITPERMLAIDTEDLRSAGLSRRKIEYMRNAAKAFNERDLTRDGLAEHSNSEITKKLTNIKGIGEWTSDMYLIFVLNRPDVLPLGDLAIRRGIEDLYSDGNGGLTREEMVDVAEVWRPYRSIGTRYIWADYESA